MRFVYYVPSIYHPHEIEKYDWNMGDSSILNLILMVSIDRIELI